MRFAFLAAVLGLCGAHSVQTRNYDTHDYYAVHLDDTISPRDVASHLGLEVDGPLANLQHHYLFKAPKHNHNVIRNAVRTHRQRRRRDLGYENVLLDSILLHQKQELKPPKVKRAVIADPLDRRQFASIGSRPVDHETGQLGKDIASELGITDPIYADQWHLYNAVQKGHDLNVTGVWLQGITGKNATVCIVDDGLDFESEDLRDNYFAGGSWDFNDVGPDPKPRLSDDRHGTRCAGEVAAGRNNVCGVGVAYDSRIAGIRILSKAITDADEAEAMVYGVQENDIYSCSWGPPDDGQEMGEPGILIKRAMLKAVQEGRHGLGTIYVFAAGNGAAADDNCNFDGYTNSIYSITVGAIDREGVHPYYSEKCSAQLVVTYSSGSGDAIHTTDVGTDTCYSGHGGTSAAGPLAAGALALVLEARPDLTWRDAQYLTMNTAAPVDQVSDWQTTTIGKNFSHQFGYGKLDVFSLVEAAKKWKKVKAQAWYTSPWQHIRHEIPQGDVGLSSTYVISQDIMRGANIARLEHVTVTMNVEHQRRGDLAVELRSPSGVISHLSTNRKRDNYNGGYDDWTFMSVAHWGESGVGAWTIVVKDLNDNEFTGTFVDWRLNLFGESINPDKQGLLPLPDQHDDDEHDRETGSASTTAVTPLPSPTSIENPDDHIDRPVNVKTSGTPEPLATTTTAAFETPIEATSTPTAAEDTTASDETSVPFLDDGTEDETETPHDSNFLPSPFPTFGVSKRTQVWIYGAFALIGIFCVGIGAFFWVARRKRLRNEARDNYEFEVLDDDDDDNDGNAGGKHGGRRGKRRAGELYDAFAGESDEELFSEDERYEDEKSGLNEKRRLSRDEGSSSGTGHR